jgi:hypothetical protein
MTLEIHVMVWDRHKTVAGLNQLIGCLPLFIAGSVNDRINMDSTIAELMNAGN